MTAGLQTWDAQGNLIIDITTRLSKLVGSVEVNEPGSIAVAVPDGNELWATLLLHGWPDLSAQNFPSVTISGNVLSWAYAGSANRVTATMLYGVY